MPRQARQYAYSGYYHVIVRGIGKQILFEEESDYLFYLSILKKYSLESNVIICAYCLMSNHVHLLIYDSDKNISLMMKKLGVSYTWFFNTKYERTGHLVQDRFLSETVENEGYLLTVFRYILNNPKKAGICRSEDYRWSSYHEYGKTNSFVKPGIIAERIGNSDKFRNFMNTEDETDIMEFEKVHHDDQWAEKVMREMLNEKSGISLQQMEANDRNNMLLKLHQKGITIRQLERLTGINRGVIQRTCVKENRPC